MSPSPQRQIDRNDWNLESPAKFELKLDPVASSKKSKDVRIDLAPAQVEQTFNNEAEEEEMSSHDLSAEEQQKDLLMF